MPSAEQQAKAARLKAAELWQPYTVKWFAVIVGGALAYAIMRYHIAGDVEWSHFPLFILNKATSLAAVAFVACSYLVGKIFHWHDHNKQERLVVIKFCGLMGFFLAVAHALFSLAALSSAYYGKYFLPDGRLNFEGELAIAVAPMRPFSAMVANIWKITPVWRAWSKWRPWRMVMSIKLSGLNRRNSGDSK